MASESETMRAEFEAWALGRYEGLVSLAREGESYVDPDMAYAWAGYQAGRAPSAEAKDAALVERVARAMHASENKTSGWTWEDCSPIEVEGWKELAEAAIAAIAQKGAAAAQSQEG